MVSTAVLAEFARLGVPRPYFRLPLCPIHRFTGLLCPGCGATHALAALLHGRWLEAFHHNPLVTVLLPFLLAYAAVAYVRALQHRQPAWPRIPPAALAVLYALTAAFTVARNLP